MQTVNHESICQLLANVNTDLNPSELAADQPLFEFGYNSLDKIGIVMSLEDKFSLRISDSDSVSLVSIESIAEYVNAQLKSN